MYSRKQFAFELKEKIYKQESITKIGEWAYTTYLNHIDDIDLDFRDILITLNTMELGPEFEFSYEELNQIADDLIAGKDVEL